MVHEDVALKLFEQWSSNWGLDGTLPDYGAYHRGDALNGVGLTAEHFREASTAIAPYDTAENVARRMCLDFRVPECCGIKGRAPCNFDTCAHWGDWLPYAEEIVRVGMAKRDAT